MFGAGDYRQGVAHVQFTYQINVKLEAGDLELGRRWSVTDVECFEGVVFAEPETLHRAMRHIQQRRQI